MAKLEFEELSFEKEGEGVRVTFLNNYYFDLSQKELLTIGKFKIGKNFIEFDVSEAKANKKFNNLITLGFSRLKNKLGGKNTIYIHQNLGVPLIGLNYFGIVDRNSSLIEVKPLTGCNFNCVYCSIDEGISSTKQNDFVIEKDYMVQEVKKLVDSKDCDQIEVYINPHGEPLLYKPLASLISDLKKIKEIKRISISTNGLLLTKEKVDELVNAGLDKINISLNSIDSLTAKKMAGVNYEPEKLLEICKYISKQDVALFIAPVWLPSFNDEEIPKLIEFCKELDAKLCIQNFLNYKFGRNPVKALPMGEFFDKLKKLEKKHDIKLIVDASDFKVIDTKKLPKPFKKNDKIHAKILFNGRLKGEKIAFSGDRLISIPNCEKTGKTRLKIVRSKHNVFMGVIC
jgi:uncharacterized protein